MPGNNKRVIYLDDLDRILFLDRLARVARKYGWKILVYCLMDNHYHLVIEIDERGMSRGLCELNTGHAVMFNQRHGRINHLFGRRYWSRKLVTEQAFLNACRYVLRNPIRAGLVDRAEQWRWSSYRATVGLALAALPLASDEILLRFSTTAERAVERFIEFIHDDEVDPDPTGPAWWQPP